MVSHPPTLAQHQDPAIASVSRVVEDDAFLRHALDEEGGLHRVLDRVEAGREQGAACEASQPLQDDVRRDDCKGRRVPGTVTTWETSSGLPSGPRPESRR